MKSCFNKASILSAAPFTVGSLFFFLFCIAFLRDLAVSGYVWSYSQNDLVWMKMMIDRPFSGDFFYTPFLIALTLWAISIVLFEFAGKFMPLPEESCEPFHRGVDTSLNRFIGIVLVLSSIYFFYGFYSGDVLVLPAAVMFFGWGLWLVVVPFENRVSYSISAHAFSGMYDSFSSSDVKKLFEMWMDRFVRRRAREESQRAKAHQSSGSESDGSNDHSYQSSGSSGRTDYRSQNKQYEEKSKKQASSSIIGSPWEVLGVSPETSMKDIRKKWMELCKRYHPDLVPKGLKDETEEALKKVNVAYRQIRDELKRKK